MIKEIIADRGVLRVYSEYGVYTYAPSRMTREIAACAEIFANEVAKKMYIMVHREYGISERQADGLLAREGYTKVMYA